MSANAIAFVSDIGDVDTTARDTLGSIRYDVNGVYKYVQFGATRTGQVTASLVKGDVVCYVLGTTADLDLLTLVDSANSVVGAGVVQGTNGVLAANVAVPATGGPYYGWVKIRGLVTLSNAAGGSPAAGSILTTTSATAKQVTVITTATSQVVGSYIDATNHIADVSFPY